MSRFRCALMAAGALALACPQRGLAQSSATYTYDALGRVVTSTTSTGVATYSYDTADNRVHFNASPPNHPPVANADALTVTVGSPASLNPLANDTDPDGDAIHISSVGGSLNSKGTVTWDGATTVTYAPNANASGTDIVGYWIQDAKGATTQGTIYVTINRPPVANSDSLLVQAGGSASINPLTNDSDPDGDAIHITTVGGAYSGKGTVTWDGANTITFAAAAGSSGGDLVGYDISDNRGGTAHGTVWVAINRPPVANTDNLTVPHNTPASINPLANDTDPDGDPLTITAVGGAYLGHGTVSWSGSTITFTPTPGFSGGDLVGYFISDGRGGAAQGTIWISVQ